MDKGCAAFGKELGVFRKCYLAYFVEIILFHDNMLIMTNTTIIELSKVYKRIMEVETELKNRIRVSLILTFNNSFSVMLPYLNKISHTKYLINNKKGNCVDKINNIINSNLSENKKTENLIKIIYLSDLLSLLTDYKKLYLDRKFINNLNFSSFDLNFIKKYKNPLCKLRNNVMHFNIDEYSQNKKLYIEALGYWERLLYCSNAKLQQLPKVKPNIMPILKMLDKEYPEILQMDDRTICEVVEDILFINNVPFEKQQKYWTILRQLYEFKRKKKRNDF